MRNSPQKLPGEWRTTYQPIVCYNPYTAKQELLLGVPNAKEVPYLMENLHNDFERWFKSDIDPLILIALYMIEFYTIHPFRDGNGRTGRLLLLLMLYKTGHPIGRFVSLEHIFTQTLHVRNWAAAEAQKDLNKILDNALPWVEYVLEVIVAAYRGFETNRKRSIYKRSAQVKKKQ